MEFARASSWEPQKVENAQLRIIYSFRPKKTYDEVALIKYARKVSSCAQTKAFETDPLASSISGFLWNVKSDSLEIYRSMGLEKPAKATHLKYPLC